MPGYTYRLVGLIHFDSFEQWFNAVCEHRNITHEVVWSPTTSTFKASLDSHWFDIGHGYEQRPRAWTLFCYMKCVYPSNNNKNNKILPSACE